MNSNSDNQMGYFKYRLIFVLLAQLLLTSCSMINALKYNSEIYPQKYPQQNLASVIQALENNDIKYFTKHLLHPDERSFYENELSKVRPSWPAKLALLLKDFEGAVIEEFGEDAHIQNEKGLVVFNRLKRRWYFKGYFDPLPDDNISEIDDKGNEEDFVISEEGNILSIHHKYLLELPDAYILFEITNPLNENKSVKWQNEYLNFTKESATIQWRKYDKNFKEINFGAEAVSSGSWSLYVDIPVEKTLEIIDFNPVLEIDKFSLRFSYRSVNMFWVSLSSDCRLAIADNVKGLTDEIIRGLQFYNIKGQKVSNCP